MTRPNQLLRLLALLLAFALVAAACGSDDGSASDATTDDTSEAAETDASESDDEDAMEEDAMEDDALEEDAMEEESDGEAILRVAMQFGPDSGLAIETDDASVLARAAVVERLVRADETGTPVPWLAESWERIDDTTWQFVLRTDVVFHDGAPFNAAAVETALTYISGVASPPRSLSGLTLSTEIVDDFTVRVVTSDPDPILPLRLSSRALGILSPAAYDSAPTEPIGSGPFMVADFTPPDSLTVERFDDYWGEVALLDGAELRFIPDAGARAAALRADEVDVADGIAIPDLEALEDDGDIDLIGFSRARTATLYTNTASGPMSNIAVREAVSLAIDQVTIAEDLLEGQFTVAGSLFGPENPWAPQRDAAAADAADQAAAVVEGLSAEDRSISIWTYTGRDELADMATVVQAQLQAVGFEVDVEVGEYTPLEARVFEGEHDMFLGSRGYYFDIADAGAVFSSDYTCEGGYNLNLYCSAAFDEIIAELNLADSTADRQALFAEAAQVLLDEYVGLSLVHDRARYAARTDVQGLSIDPFETTLLSSQVSLG